MYALVPGEETAALTTGVTMLDIPVAEFAKFDDANIQVIGYAIGVEGVSTTPAMAWEVCKEQGGM